jgi:tetratricopeptide (TPR) repeat protein
MTRLINNYGAAFMRLSRYYHDKGDMQKAMEYMNRAIRYVDDKSRFYLAMATMYSQNKDRARTVDLLNKALVLDPRNQEKLQQAAFIMLNLGDNNAAVNYMEASYDAIMSNPNEAEKVQQMTDLGIFVYRASQQYDLGARATALLQKIEPYLQQAQPDQQSQQPTLPIP